MKHVELFENYNPNNWGPKSGYWDYKDHPFVGKKAVDLCPSFKPENCGAEKEVLVDYIEIVKKDANGYWGYIYLIDPKDPNYEYQNTFGPFHFYTDNDETIKILSRINGDDRACFCIPGKDTFVSLGHDGPLIYDTITGNLIMSYGW